MLSNSAAVSVVRDLLPQWASEKERLDYIDRWHRWTQEDVKLPRRATSEHKALAELSKTPWLYLVVASVSQCLHVDGWRTSAPDDGDKDNGPWRTWMANAFDRRQIAVHTAALEFGYAFVRVLPGEDEFGVPRASMRGVSPRNSYAVWQDPAEDDWPMYALQVFPAPGGKRLVHLYDETHVYYLEADDDVTGDVEFIDSRVHDAGVTPWIRYGMPDLEGRCVGRVEPFIPMAARINKTAYDRMLTQHFNSWKVRTVAGMSEPETEEEKRRKQLQLRQGDLLVADDPDTKFGSLPETPLEGFVQAWRSDIEALAAVSQTPTHELTGQLVNLSDDALAAARAGLTRNAFEWRTSFGASHAQALRLAAHLEGNEEVARDVSGRVTWQDMEIRSMSQAVDALGKAAQMLEVPVEALWSRIPGVERTDVEEWREMAERADPVERIAERLSRQSGGE